MNAYLASNCPASRHPRTGLKSLGELLERLVQVYERQNAEEAARNSPAAMSPAMIPTTIPATIPVTAGARADRPASRNASRSGTRRDWAAESVAPARCYQTTFEFFEAGVS